MVACLSELGEVDDLVKAIDEVALVSDTHQGGPAGAHIVEQEREDSVGILRIEVAGGLIGKNQFGRRQQGSADRDALTLSLGKVMDVALQLVTDADHLGEFTGTREGVASLTLNDPSNHA